MGKGGLKPHLRTTTVRAAVALSERRVCIRRPTPIHHKFGLLISLLLFSTFCLSQTLRTDWAQLQFSPDHAGVNPYEHILSPSTVGSLQLKWSASFSYINTYQPSIVGGVVYTDGWDGKLHALNAITGRKLWTYNSGCLMAGTPAVVGGVVYAGTYCNFIALDASTGTELWSYPRSMDGSTAIVDGVVYVVSGNYGDSYVSALNASTGAELWSVSTGSDTISSPAVANGMIFFGDGKGLHARDTSTGAKRWDYAAAGDLYGRIPAVANGVVYVGSTNNSFYAVDASTGSKLWSYTTGGGAGYAPAVADGVVYFGSHDQNVYALDASTGTKLWSINLGVDEGTIPTVANGVVYIGSDNGNLYALDPNTGATLWSYKIGHYNRSSSVVNGMLYVTADDDLYSPSYVYAFQLPPTVKHN